MKYRLFFFKVAVASSLFLAPYICGHDNNNTSTVLACMHGITKRPSASVNINQNQSINIAELCCECAKLNPRNPGASGNTGPTGNPGATGRPGTTGNTGNMGTQGPTGNPGSAGSTGNQGTTGNPGATGGSSETIYIAAYATALQFATVANTYQDIQFPAITKNKGWSTLGTLPAGFTGFIPSATGVYLFQFHGSVQGNSIGSSEIRVLLDGTEILGSQSFITNINLNLDREIANGFIKTINATGIITFQYASSSTNNPLHGETIAGAQAAPSITMAITKVQ